MFSAAFGKNVKALGEFSFAIGDSSRADGKYAIAMGEKNIAGGDRSVLLGGLNSDGSGNPDVVLIGTGNNATGIETYIIGKDNYIKAGRQHLLLGHENKNVGGGDNNYMIGFGNKAQGNVNFAFGYLDSVSGNFAFGIGNQNKVAGGQSYALGRENIVQGQDGYAIGTKGHIGITANNSMNFQMSNATPTYGAGADLLGNANRTIPGVIVDDNVMAIQGGNVSIGRESDMFAAVDGAGNLFVGGDILYGGTFAAMEPRWWSSYCR